VTIGPRQLADSAHARVSGSKPNWLLAPATGCVAHRARKTGEAHDGAAEREALAERIARGLERRPPGAYAPR
jgi:hypothetical protein